MGRQERLRDLGSIAELLEGNAEAVNPCRISLVDAHCRFYRGAETEIHGSEHRRLIRIRHLKPRPYLAGRFADTGGTRVLELPVRFAEQLFFPPLELRCEGSQQGHRLRGLG